MRPDVSKGARLRGPTVYLGGVPEPEMELLIAEFAARRQARAARAAKRMGPPVIELNGPGRKPGVPYEEPPVLPSTDDHIWDAGCPCCNPAEEDWD